MIHRIKGTQDFLDLRLYNFLLDTVKKHCVHYNFTEIATPLLEPTTLFQRALGDATDVISKEMYSVTAQGSDEAISLRPEATASTMRAFLNAGIQTMPWKAFTYGPMFRHERPQKGRYRQFHQVSLEIIGSNSIAQDAYFIALLERLFQDKLKLENYALLINFLGTSEDRAQFKRVLKKFLDEHTAELCATCMVRKEINMLRIFDCKNPTCKELYTRAPHITDHLSEASSAEWNQLQSLLQQLSISYSCAPSLVRGLDYYSKTVFEFVSTELGAQNAFCGGGRYNNLATELGASRDYPAIGAAFGIERLLLMLENNPRITLPSTPALTVVIPVAPAQQALCLHISDHLQQAGIATDILLEGNSLKSMLNTANKLGARWCIIIGEDELQAGTAQLKNMLTGSNETVKHIELAEKIKQI